MITILDKRMTVVPGDPPAYLIAVKINDSDNICYLNIIYRKSAEYTLSDTNLAAIILREIYKEFEEIKFYEAYGSIEETKKSKFAAIFKQAYNVILYYSKKDKLD